MSGQVLYLAMVLAAFAAFIVTLASVSVWARLNPGKRSAARLQARPTPLRAAVAQA